MFLFIFIFTQTQKRYYKLIIISINENYETSKYENRQNYFFNDMTNIEHFGPSLLNIDRVSFESNDSIIYDIKYIKNINSLNSF